jgi:hypothetical protein
MLCIAEMTSHDRVTARIFDATLQSRLRGGIAIKLPFNPSTEWGERQRHYVTGTIAGRTVRGRLSLIDDEYYLELGPAWCRDASVAADARVTVSLSPEGPQVAGMAPDLAAAFASEPDARRFFESLPTFYRKNFVRWIEQAKHAETRAMRIAETLATLEAGKRER